MAKKPKTKVVDGKLYEWRPCPCHGNWGWAEVV